MSDDKQKVDSAITRIEYKINKADAETPREKVEKNVESRNIEQMKNKEDKR